MHDGAPRGVRTARGEADRLLSGEFAYERSWAGVTVRVEDPESGDAGEDGVLGGQREAGSQRDGSYSPVGLVVLAPEPVTGTNTPRAQIDVCVGHLLERWHSGGSGDEPVEHPTSASPHPATSAPKRISATTVKGRTQIAGSSSGA